MLSNCAEPPAAGLVHLDPQDLALNPKSYCPTLLHLARSLYIQHQPYKCSAKKSFFEKDEIKE